MKSKEELARRQAELRKRNPRTRRTPYIPLAPFRDRADAVMSALRQTKQGYMEIDALRRRLAHRRDLGFGWFSKTILGLRRLRILKQAVIPNARWGTPIGFSDPMTQIWGPWIRPLGAIEQAVQEDSPEARCAQKIRYVLTCEPRIPRRDLQNKTRASRVGL